MLFGVTVAVLIAQLSDGELVAFVAVLLLACYLGGTQVDRDAL